MIAGYRTMFALSHRKALLATQAPFHNVQLPSLADDTHILGPLAPINVGAFHHYGDKASADQAEPPGEASQLPP